MSEKKEQQIQPSDCEEPLLPAQQAREQLAELMARAQLGDPDAYQVLLTEIEPLVRAYVSRKIFRINDRDDVVQDAMLSIHLARDSFDPRRQFLPWMHTIVHHRLVDYLRRRKRQPESAELSEEGWEGAHGPASIAFNEALSSLSETQRKLLESLVDSDNDRADLAEQLGIDAGYLRVQVHRLYSRLKIALEL